MPVKFEMKVSQIRLPNWTGGDEQFWRNVEQAVSDGIIENILTQKQADGSALERNKPSTRARKLRERKPLLSLVDTLRRFIRPDGGSWRLRPVTKKGAITGTAIRPATNELKALSRRLQGPPFGLHGRGYAGWFGINKTAAERIKKALTAFVKREIRKSERRSR